MIKAATIATVATLLTIIGGAWAGIETLDGRYAPMAAFDDLSWSLMREQIRDLKDRIAKARNPELRRDLEMDLQDLLDRFCKRYPDDRLCQ